MTPKRCGRRLAGCTVATSLSFRKPSRLSANVDAPPICRLGDPRSGSASCRHAVLAAGYRGRAAASLPRLSRMVAGKGQSRAAPFSLRWSSISRPRDGVTVTVCASMGNGGLGCSARFCRSATTRGGSRSRRRLGRRASSRRSGRAVARPSFTMFACGWVISTEASLPWPDRPDAVPLPLGVGNRDLITASLSETKLMVLRPFLGFRGAGRNTAHTYRFVRLRRVLAGTGFSG